MNAANLAFTVNNDFRQNQTIFELLKEFKVKDLTTPVSSPTPTKNGDHASEPVANGTPVAAAN